MFFVEIKYMPSAKLKIGVQESSYNEHNDLNYADRLLI